MAWVLISDVLLEDEKIMAVVVDHGIVLKNRIDYSHRGVSRFDISGTGVPDTRGRVNIEFQCEYLGGDNRKEWIAGIYECNEEDHDNITNALWEKASG